MCPSPCHARTAIKWSIFSAQELKYIAFHLILSYSLFKLLSSFWRVFNKQSTDSVHTSHGNLSQCSGDFLAQTLDDVGSPVYHRLQKIGEKRSSSSTDIQGSSSVLYLKLSLNKNTRKKTGAWCLTLRSVALKGLKKFIFKFKAYKNSYVLEHMDKWNTACMYT